MSVSKPGPNHLSFGQREGFQSGWGKILFHECGVLPLGKYPTTIGYNHHGTMGEKPYVVLLAATTLIRACCFIMHAIMSLTEKLEGENERTVLIIKGCEVDFQHLVLKRFKFLTWIQCQVPSRYLENDIVSERCKKTQLKNVTNPTFKVCSSRVHPKTAYRHQFTCLHTNAMAHIVLIIDPFIWGKMEYTLPE